MEDEDPKCGAGQDDLWGIERPPRDVWIQISISVALGLGAFLIFCVCICSTGNEWVTLIPPAPSSAMERPLRRAQEADGASNRASRAPRQLFWLDSTAMEDIRGAGSGISWP